MTNEADTCRKLITPALYQAGWTDDQISQEYPITNGRIVVLPNNRTRRKEQKRADYLLRYKSNLTIAIVEAKSEDRKASEGLQQAMDYARMVDASFAYAANGHEIIEHDFLTGKEQSLTSFPSPQSLWERLKPTLRLPAEESFKRYATPSLPVPGKPPRYYQDIAVNRVVQAILQGKSRVLLTMATGTGKTDVAFHICWKLWSTGWNRKKEPRKPRILFLSDRTFLVDGPKDKQFAPFGDARWKIQGEAKMGREMYFATYQAIAEDPGRRGLFRDFPADYFDLIVVDECHRGSAEDESNWRMILEYFQSAYQLGMTATPLHEDNKDTYAYFGSPIYVYTLKQGIEDGFLAPYRVHRIVSDVDAAGYRPEKGELDLKGRPIPDQEYMTPDFERVLSYKARTEAMARRITEFLQGYDPFAKTIVFCVDQEHAAQMRMALANLNVELIRKHPDYTVQITSDDGKQYLDAFQEPEKDTPTIVTTSRLLSTGVDVQTCKVVAICRMVNSMTEFKQIIGRGTRVRDDYNKTFFTILDFTGSATRHFADPEFDGDPVDVQETKLSEPISGRAQQEQPADPVNAHGDVLQDKSNGEGYKFYIEGRPVEIVADVVYDLDENGHRLKAVSYTDYVADQLGKRFRSAADFRSHWSKADEREALLGALHAQGVDLDDLAEAAKLPDADPFDLLCHVAFSLPVKTRRERAELLKRQKPDFFHKYSQKAQAVLEAILEKYVQHGAEEFRLPDVLKLDPFPDKYGTIPEIAVYFGGPDKLNHAVSEMQNLLYGA